RIDFHGPRFADRSAALGGGQGVDRGLVDNHRRGSVQVNRAQPGGDFYGVGVFDLLGDRGALAAAYPRGFRDEAPDLDLVALGGYQSAVSVHAAVVVAHRQAEGVSLTFLGGEARRGGGRAVEADGG